MDNTSITCHGKALLNRCCSVAFQPPRLQGDGRGQLSAVRAGPAVSGVPHRHRLQQPCPFTHCFTPEKTNSNGNSTHRHLFFSRGRTRQRQQRGKTQLLGPTGAAQLPSPTRRHSRLQKVLCLVKRPSLVWSHGRNGHSDAILGGLGLPPRHCHSGIEPPQPEALTLRNQTNCPPAGELTALSGLHAAAGTQEVQSASGSAGETKACGLKEAPRGT